MALQKSYKEYENMYWTVSFGMFDQVCRMAEIVIRGYTSPQARTENPRAHRRILRDPMFLTVKGDAFDTWFGSEHEDKIARAYEFVKQLELAIDGGEKTAWFADASNV
jgi:hypothetical protein